MANKDKKSGAKASDKATGDKATEGPKTTEFVRTDETLKYPWERMFESLQPGEKMAFPDHEYRTVRDRAVQWAKRSGIVLATALIKNVPTVLRVEK